ncbi:MAG TPA: ADP-ribosylglycohydrolase family protein, partial [Kofleriaceae bacterium]|nr:ADP-ribosylglycohydrolase family protein [Kofleriaceae bacterium]
MQDVRARGALLGLAVGDALGTTLEFERPTPTTPTMPWCLLEGPHRDITGGGPFDVEPGQTTDDTQMATCLASSLAAHGRFVRDDVLRAYLAWEPHAFDVGNLTATALSRGEDLHAGRLAWEASGRESAGNGSLMRTAPIGAILWNDVAARREAALTDSALTHFDPRCQLACAAFDAAIARAIASPELPGSPWALHGAAELELHAAAELLRGRHPDLVSIIDAAEDALADDLHLATLDDPCLSDLVHAAQGFVRVSFRLAFWHLLHAPTFEAALIDAVNRGGDADTNAAITGALLGAFHGAGAIPARWSRPVLAALADRCGHPLRELYHPRVLLAALDSPAAPPPPCTCQFATGTMTGTSRGQPFLAVDRHYQRRLVWDELIGKGALPWDQAIRTAARGLRDKGLLVFTHLHDTSPAYDAIRDLIEKELRSEVPLFDRGDDVRGQVRAIVSGPDVIR